jgi:hypothetical protein
LLDVNHNLLLIYVFSKSRMKAPFTKRQSFFGFSCVL